MYPQSSFPLISIIIPVYNAEKYISECLSSIINQNYNNIEIVLAYDTKSTDNTWAILEKYSKKYQNIVIDSAQDRSSGDARNRGFAKSHGEFISFIDADDVLMPTYVSDLLSVLMEHPNLNTVCCKAKRCSDKTILLENDLNKKDSNTKPKIYDNYSAFRSKLWGLKNSFRLPDAAWSWMIKRDYLIERDISFPSYSYGEDALFTYKVVLYSEYVGVIDKTLYLYRYNNYDSASSRRPKYYWDLYVQSYSDRLSLLETTHPEYISEFLEYQKYQYVMYLLRFEYKYYRTELSKKNINKIRVKTGDLHLYAKWIIRLFNISKVICHYIMHIVFKLFVHA